MISGRSAALIVDDQPFVGMVTSDVLRECGFESFHAYDAGEAAEILDKHPEIELVVSEARLPGQMTGLELCRQVSRERPDVQLIVTSSGEDIRKTDVPQSAFMLHKPFPSAELRRMVALRKVNTRA